MEALSSVGAVIGVLRYQVLIGRLCVTWPVTPYPAVGRVAVDPAIRPGKTRQELGSASATSPQQGSAKTPTSNTAPTGVSQQAY
jgi:hypothetical protein